jgi:hypothetical protein
VKLSLEDRHWVGLGSLGNRQVKLHSKTLKSVTMVKITLENSQWVGLWGYWGSSDENCTQILYGEKSVNIVKRILEMKMTLEDPL